MVENNINKFASADDEERFFLSSCNTFNRLLHVIFAIEDFAVNFSYAVNSEPHGIVAKKYKDDPQFLYVTFDGERQGCYSITWLFDKISKRVKEADVVYNATQGEIIMRESHIEELKNIFLKKMPGNASTTCEETCYKNGMAKSAKLLDYKLFFSEEKTFLENDDIKPIHNEDCDHGFSQKSSGGNEKINKEKSQGRSHLEKLIETSLKETFEKNRFKSVFGEMIEEGDENIPRFTTKCKTNELLDCTDSKQCEEDKCFDLHDLNLSFVRHAEMISKFLRKISPSEILNCLVRQYGKYAEEGLSTLICAINDIFEEDICKPCGGQKNISKKFIETSSINHETSPLMRIVKNIGHVLQVIDPRCESFDSFDAKMKADFSFLLYKFKMIMSQNEDVFESDGDASIVYDKIVDVVKHSTGFGRIMENLVRKIKVTENGVIMACYKKPYKCSCMDHDENTNDDIEKKSIKWWETVLPYLNVWVVLFEKFFERFSLVDIINIAHKIDDTKFGKYYTSYSLVANCINSVVVSNLKDFENPSSEQKDAVINILTQILAANIISIKDVDAWCETIKKPMFENLPFVVAKKIFEIFDSMPDRELNQHEKMGYIFEIMATIKNTVRSAKTKAITKENELKKKEPTKHNNKMPTKTKSWTTLNPVSIDDELEVGLQIRDYLGYYITEPGEFYICNIEGDIEEIGSKLSSMRRIVHVCAKCILADCIGDKEYIKDIKMVYNATKQRPDIKDGNNAARKFINLMMHRCNFDRSLMNPENEFIWLTFVREAELPMIIEEEVFENEQFCESLRMTLKYLIKIGKDGGKHHLPNAL